MPSSYPAKIENVTYNYDKEKIFPVENKIDEKIRMTVGIGFLIM